MSSPDFWERLGVDDGGMPTHLPMGVTADGQGPTDDSEAHHWVCWCGSGCPLDRFLRLASQSEEDDRPEDHKTVSNPSGEVRRCERRDLHKPHEWQTDFGAWFNVYCPGNDGSKP